MDRLVPSTTCRCGYASPPTFPRCLGCGRRFTARCERPAPRRSPRPVADAPGADRRRPERLAPPAPSSPAAVPSAPPARIDATPADLARTDATAADLTRIDAAAAPSARVGAGGAPFVPGVPPSVPFGPVAVLGLVAAAWIEPDAPRVELLTAAAIVGAGLAALRPTATSATAQAPAPSPSTRLTDDELRDALAAW